MEGSLVSVFKLVTCKQNTPASAGLVCLGQIRALAAKSQELLSMYLKDMSIPGYLLLMTKVLVENLIQLSTQLELLNPGTVDFYTQNMAVVPAQTHTQKCHFLQQHHKLQHTAMGE